VRSGKLLSREHRFLVNVEGEEDSAILLAYLAGSYVALHERARQLLVPFDFGDRDLLEQSLGGTKILIPQRGSRRAMLDLAQQNARHLLEELRAASIEGATVAGDPVYELGRELGLQRLPRTMMCFDISTTQGTDTVGAGVWFENGRPKRGEYRKFRVKTVEGSDDFASMREVVTRYFQRRIQEEKPLPDLIVIDGGKGQLSAAHEALATLELGDRPLVSLAKREEEIFVWGREAPVKMSRRSTALRLLQRIRDEAHRFAVTYNRKRRTMRTVTSELLKVPGIGPVKRRRLLQEFGSVQGVREASEEAIARVPGFNAEQAKRLLESLAASAPV
jgi:excinuclease ABC subunit C